MKPDKPSLKPTPTPPPNQAAAAPQYQAQPTAPPRVVSGHPRPAPAFAGAAPPRPLAQLASPRVLAIAALLLLALIADVAIRYHRSSGPAPGPQPVASAFRKGGDARAHSLPAIEARSLRKAAQEIRATDKPLADIKAAHSQGWADAREKDFDDLFVKLLDEIIPEKDDRPSKDQRERYAQALEEIADGEEAGAK
jgi:hypothetical protein